MKRIFAGVILAAAVCAAQVVPGRYIVELRGEPALDTGAGKAARSASAERLATVQSQQGRAAVRAQEAGFRVVGSMRWVLNALVLEGDDKRASRLASLPEVQAVHPVVLHYPLLDRAVFVQKVTDAWNLVGGIDSAGRGVKVGIIDTGIDAAHPGFQDPDLTVPDGYPKVTNESDLGNTNNKVIVARYYGSGSGSAKDVDGHGTGVAMIVGGRTSTGPQGPITGIAPKAFLGNYKVFPDGEEGASTDLVLRAVDDAVADGMDIINLSLGSWPSPSTGLYTNAIDRANAAGVLVIAAAGNAGPDAGTIGAPAGSPSVIAVGNAYNDRQFASTLRVEGAPPVMILPASNSAGRNSISGALRDVSEVDPSGMACSTLPGDSLRGRIALILRGVCVFTEKLNHAERAGAVGAIVYTDAERPDAVIMSVDDATLPAAMLRNADGAALKERLSGNPQLNATVEFRPSAITVDSARLSASSSRGPGPDLAFKPDLLGVGTSVYTADKSNDNRPGYQISSGTSLSAPMVAGAAALLKSARPGLTTAQYRSLLVNASSTFSYGSSGVPAPVHQTGAGLLDLAASVRSTVAVAPSSINFRTGGSTVSRESVVTLTNLGTADDTFSITAEPMNGGPSVTFPESAVTLRPGESRQVPVRLEAADLPAGAQQGFLAVRSSTSDTVARVPWWYAVPSNVVASLTTGRVPDSGKRSSAQTFYVRPSDAAGLAIEAQPEVTVIGGEGKVDSVTASSQFPGFYLVRVRLGPAAGTNTFEVTAQGVTTRVIIPGE